MNTEWMSNSRRRARAGAVALTSLLIAGAAWYGVGAEPASALQARPATVVAGSPAVAAGQASYADVVSRVAPAVVTIETEGRAAMRPTNLPDDDELRRFFGDRFEGVPRAVPAPMRRGIGSGVITTADGYVLTNHHVVAEAASIRVALTDGRTFKATLVGSDPPSDLAVLKVEAQGLPTLPLGDSDQVRVGDIVLAVGNPLGIGQTVTAGIVSAKGRSMGSGDGSYEDFLQTDAPINHGNSGGALVNLRGELVGINSQILSPGAGNIGIGFAIPANMVRHVMTELRTEGRVRRAQLGVVIQPVTSDIAASLGLSDVRGAIVSQVEAGSPADHAGVRRGDIILSFNGEAVTDANAMRNRVAAAGPGSAARLVVLRAGREQTLSATLREAPSSQQAGGPAAVEDDRTALGVAVAPLTPEHASRLGLRSDASGLLVQSVSPESRAASAGIREGDVIAEANQTPVGSVETLRGALRRTPDRPVLLLIHREGRSLFVTVGPA